MNVLTKNRILQKGDEYYLPGNNAWKPVPKDNFGLQVQFTDYAEVRRPSEKPFPVTPTPDTDASRLAGQGSPSNDSHPAPTARKVQTSEGVKRSPSPDKPESGREPISDPRIGRWPKPISPDNVASLQVAPNIAKAEKEKTPAPTPSGAGELPQNYKGLIPAAEKVANAASYLPTVVSKKAHSQERDREIIDSIPYDLPMTDEEQAALNREKDREMERITPKAIRPEPFTKTEIAAAKATLSKHIKINFPLVSAGSGNTVPIWTGRNGTFSGYGLDCMKLEGDRVGVLPPDDHIMLSPIGKRGVGNCTIQFPIAIIPQLVEWLEDQSKGTPK